MANSNTHVVDIGDDYLGVECRCLAIGCNWRFKSADRHERLSASYCHIAQVTSE